MQGWTPLEGHVNLSGPGWVAELRFAEDERGRVECTHIEIDGIDGPVEAEAVRRFPLARYIAWLNGAQGGNARKALRLGGAVTLVASPAPTRLRIAGSAAAPKPTGFYERVAELYSALRAQGEVGAAKRIAQANGVPVTTVHGWIKEARRRGILPPGKRRTAG